MVLNKMTQREAKKIGATHYMESTIDLGDKQVTYFKNIDGKYFEYFSHHFARYETGVCSSLIKPL